VTKKKSDTAPTPPPPSFEEALAELETLVETLEKGDQSLEDSLKSFERGVTLARTCKDALDKAEQQVTILTAPDEDADPMPFDNPPPNDS